jgi:hypothetical protein
MQGLRPDSRNLADLHVRPSPDVNAHKLICINESAENCISILNFASTLGSGGRCRVVGRFWSHLVLLPHVDIFGINFVSINGVRKSVLPLVQVLQYQFTKDGSAGHIANCFSLSGGAGEVPRELDLDGIRCRIGTSNLGKRSARKMRIERTRATQNTQQSSPDYRRIWTVSSTVFTKNFGSTTLKATRWLHKHLVAEALQVWSLQGGCTSTLSLKLSKFGRHAIWNKSQFQ